jgi:signal transduction histidine kinase
MKSEQARAGEGNTRSADQAARGGAGRGVPVPGVDQNPIPEGAQSLQGAILRELSDGIMVVDRTGHVVFANPAAASLCDRAAPADLVGHPVSEIAARFEVADEEGGTLSIESFPGGDAAVADVGGVAERLVSFRRSESSDEVRWALVKATRALGAGGEVAQTIYAIRDVTDRERERRRQRADNARLVAEAQEALRSREDLLAIVSHDLRNPLGVVLTSSALLLRAPLPPDKQDRARRQVEAIQRAGNRMNRLIRDLLDFASVERGRLVLTRRSVNVGALVAEVLLGLRPLGEPKSQELAADSPTESLAVDGDHDRLVQVFASIVGNSFKFGAEGGHVRIAAAADGACVVFTVSDDGPGMAPEELENLFDRAWQAERKTRDGIGLGLSIVKGIVEAHGGRIWAQSALGEGTRISFTIPAATCPTGVA